MTSLTSLSAPSINSMLKKGGVRIDVHIANFGRGIKKRSNLPFIGADIVVVKFNSAISVIVDFKK